MAVHKRGYQRYDGPLTARWARLMVLPRFAWEGLMRDRRIIMIFILALFWPMACLMFIYLSNHTELLLGFGDAFKEFLKIDSGFFVNFMNTQGMFAVWLATFAGPSLIAPDLANGALPLYFSRPLSRPQYVLSRMLVLAGVLSPVTWIPGVVLFAVQSSLAGWSWTAENWMLGVGILLGFLLWVVFVSLVAMTSSAYVKWRVVSGALVIGFFFVLGGAAEVTRAVLRADWPVAFSPTHAANQVWRAMLGAEALPGPDALQCFLTMAALSLLLLYVLERKLRPVEVVS
jgi:ABC-2 type transport system permease protein